MAEHMEHSVVVPAAADEVYAIIADVRQWPRIFPPTIHAEVLSTNGSSERIRLWATANDTVKTWTSLRELDKTARRVTFRQEISAPPVASMGGSWIMEPLPDGSTLVRLLHSFTALEPSDVSWITEAVDRNSTAELGALRDAVSADSSLVMRISDSVPVSGPEIYDFLYRADLWPARLSHVDRVELVEDTPNLQSLEMDTRAPNGSSHTTRSIRVCVPSTKIVYKQLVLPALLSLHIGEWSIGPSSVTSTHTVVLKRSAIPGVLGAGATVDSAREFVANALSTNSLATLTRAKEFSEGSAPLSR
jgi:aromatase